VRRLVARFYELMDTLPEAYGIRKLHQPDLASAEQKLYLYLTGWLGGPQLYVEKYGHPRLRARHLPFPIGSSEAEQWMLCMRRRWPRLSPTRPARVAGQALNDLAYFMRNREDTPASLRPGFRGRRWPARGAAPGVAVPRHQAGIGNDDADGLADHHHHAQHRQHQHQARNSRPRRRRQKSSAR
jgi:hemoglobin